MERPDVKPPSKKGTFECPDSDFLAKWPGLAAGLCDVWWSDGKPRRPWKLSVSFGSDGVHLCVTDPDHKLVCFTTAPALTECFDAVEQMIEDKVMPWRKSRF